MYGGGFRPGKGVTLQGVEEMRGQYPVNLRQLVSRLGAERTEFGIRHGFESWYHFLAN